MLNPDLIHFDVRPRTDLKKAKNVLRFCRAAAYESVIQLQIFRELHYIRRRLEEAECCWRKIQEDDRLLCKG